MSLVKVSADSHTTLVAGSIAGIIRDGQPAEVRAIGVDAVYQAVKAIVLARKYLLEEGCDIACCPEFRDIAVEGKDKTSILFVVDAMARKPGTPDW